MPHNLMLGDCLERMKDITDGSVDMVLCDLPYGTTACTWDAVIPFEPLWSAYWRVLKKAGVVVLTSSQPFTSAVVMSQPKAFKCEWIWRKNAGSNFGSVRFQPMKEHESVLVFARARSTYNPVMQERALAGKTMVRAGVRSKASAGLDVYGGANKGYDNSKQNPDFRFPSSVQVFNRQRGLHPTQKPVPLMEYLIKTYTHPGDTVLDNCMGSGTTGVACVNSGRRFIGIERERNYFEIASNRISDSVGGLEGAMLRLESECEMWDAR